MRLSIANLILIGWLRNIFTLCSPRLVLDEFRVGGRNHLFKRANPILPLNLGVILTGSGHENKSYSLTGDPAISFADIATILSEVSATKVPYTPVSDEEYIKIKLAEGRPAFVVEFGLKWAQGIGVNPSVETVWNWHTCSLMIFPSQTSSSLSG